MESGRAELTCVRSRANVAWQITLSLEIGLVTIPGTFRTASVAEAVAREQVATLGFQVVGALYEPSRIQLELRRPGPGDTP